MLGVSEKQWEIWVEMEMAQFSVPINCRKYVLCVSLRPLLLILYSRCQHSGFVDREDLEAESEIHCPFSGCDHVWCKKCEQTIDSSGPKHSCDGTSELDHLMKQQGWRYCPSESNTTFRVWTVLHFPNIDCKTPIQKVSGCNHLSVRRLFACESP